MLTENKMEDTPLSFFDAQRKNVEATLIRHALQGYSSVFMDIMRLLRYFPESVSSQQKSLISNELDGLGYELENTLNELFQETAKAIKKILENVLVQPPV